MTMWVLQGVFRPSGILVFRVRKSQSPRYRAVVAVRRTLREAMGRPDDEQGYVYRERAEEGEFSGSRSWNNTSKDADASASGQRTGGRA